jgi:hypothetical protein
MCRQINCVECGEYCGEIRDATIKKNLKFLCHECHTLKENGEIKYKETQYDYDLKFFKELFN